MAYSKKETMEEANIQQTYSHSSAGSITNGITHHLDKCCSQPLQHRPQPNSNSSCSCCNSVFWKCHDGTLFSKVGQEVRDTLLLLQLNSQKSQVISTVFISFLVFLGSHKKQKRGRQVEHYQCLQNFYHQGKIRKVCGIRKMSPIIFQLLWDFSSYWRVLKGALKSTKSAFNYYH